MPRKSEKVEKEKESRTRNWKKMVVEDASAVAPKSLENQTLTNPNPNPVEEDDEAEEGEIVGEEDSSGSSKPSKGLVHQQHPLEHSWTFWFDNPNAKSKQVAWGSSMRPIYTFTTVEEFWR